MAYRFGMIGFLILGSLCQGHAFAQTSPAAAGVFTSAQAARGKALYETNCSTCHGGSLQGEEEAPALSGGRFATHWAKLPLDALHSFINTQMPLGQPGMLGAAGNADVVAYILSFNGYPAGNPELPSDTSALSKITLGAKP